MQKTILISVILLITGGFAYGGWQRAKSKSWFEAQKREYVQLTDKTSTFGQVILNINGEIISWNKGMTALFGWKSSEMRGKRIESLFKADTSLADEKAAAAISATQSQPWFADGKLEIRTKDGVDKVVSVLITDTETKNGQRYRRIIFKDEQKPSHTHMPGLAPQQPQELPSNSSDKEIKNGPES